MEEEDDHMLKTWDTSNPAAYTARPDSKGLDINMEDYTNTKHPQSGHETGDENAGHESKRGQEMQRYKNLSSTSTASNQVATAMSQHGQNPSYRMPANFMGVSLQGKELTIIARYRFFVYRPIERVDHGSKPVWELKSGFRIPVTLNRDQHDSALKVVHALAGPLCKRFGVTGPYADFRKWTFWEINTGPDSNRATFPFQLANLQEHFPYIPINMFPKQSDDRFYEISTSFTCNLGPPPIDTVLHWLSNANEAGYEHNYPLDGDTLLSYSKQLKQEKSVDGSSTFPYMIEHGAQDNYYGFSDAPLSPIETSNQENGNRRGRPRNHERGHGRARGRFNDSPSRRGRGSSRGRGMSDRREDRRDDRREERDREERSYIGNSRVGGKSPSRYASRGPPEDRRDVAPYNTLPEQMRRVDERDPRFYYEENNVPRGPPQYGRENEPFASRRDDNIQLPRIKEERDDLDQGPRYLVQSGGVKNSSYGGRQGGRSFIDSPKYAGRQGVQGFKEAHYGRQGPPVFDDPPYGRQGSTLGIDPGDMSQRGSANLYRASEQPRSVPIPYDSYPDERDAREYGEPVEGLKRRRMEYHEFYDRR